MMLGVVLRLPIARAAAAVAVEFGLLVNPVGQRTLRLLPPLTLTLAEADLAVARLGMALTACAGRQGGKAAPPP